MVKEVGVSKGGLLYYFLNKEVLIEGMIVRGVEDYEGVIYNKVVEDLERKGRWVCFFVEERLNNERRIEELFSSMMVVFMLKFELFELL